MQDLFGDKADLTPASEGGASARVGVLLPLPLAGPLDYRLLDGQTTLAPGTFVRVPLSGRIVTGVVWGQGDGRYPVAKLKPIEAVLGVPPLAADLMRTIEFTAAYTLASPGAVLRMVLSSPEALKPAPVRTLVAYAEGASVEVKLTTARSRVLEVAQSAPAMPVKALAEAAGVSDGVVRGLMEAGLLVKREDSVDGAFPVPDLNRKGPALRSEQQAASEAFIGALGGFKPFLLEGVTGSGKTEVYFELVAAALRADPDAQVLVLVPEIGLTSQWLERFDDRFGCEPVVWHSDIGDAGRRRAWRHVAAGTARVVVGARSALFLPYRNLKALVVDEEHDPSFKQEEGVLYHARDMAVVRAREAGCPVVLASATPSLETRVNAAQGRYTHVRLVERHGAAVLPTIRPVDLRASGLPAGQWISPALEASVRLRLQKGEQTMLFLNRRGYAPLTLCRTCGHRFGCPSCSTWLVEHRFKSELHCHQCGHIEPAPSVCPKCDTPDALVACGPGVERLFEEVSRLFPDARVSVMTSDTMTKPSDMARMVRMISDGAIDIVIGTQLVTKGYHFPLLTLVGVIDADLGLRGGDLRAGERTYQQLTQVAGRAGRAEKKGEVMLQTYEPSHPVVDALVKGDAEGFLAIEEDTRARHHMPPFGKLVALILSGPDEAAVMAYGRTLARTAPAADGLDVLGPAPAPLTRIRGQFRARLLMHGDKSQRVQALVRSWLKRAGKADGVKLKIDIDPYSFL